MLFTIINFLRLFALVLFFTIVQATIGSFVVFLALTDCIGPANPTYAVDYTIGKLKPCLQQGKDAESTSKQQPEKGNHDAVFSA